jgi:hypothetical protein
VSCFTAEVAEDSDWVKVGLIAASGVVGMEPTMLMMQLCSSGQEWGGAHAGRFGCQSKKELQRRCRLEAQEVGSSPVK